MQGLHALFTGEDETWEAWLNSDASGFSSALSFGGNGVRLRRGYASSQSSKPTQVSSFVFPALNKFNFCSGRCITSLLDSVHFDVEWSKTGYT